MVFILRGAIATELLTVLLKWIHLAWLIFSLMVVEGEDSLYSPNPFLYVSSFQSCVSSSLPITYLWLV